MCTAGSRIFVHSKVYDDFVKGLTAAAQTAKGGTGFDPNTTSGPVVSEAQFEVGLLSVLYDRSLTFAQSVSWVTSKPGKSQVQPSSLEASA